MCLMGVRCLMTTSCVITDNFRGIINEETRNREGQVVKLIFENIDSGCSCFVVTGIFLKMLMLLQLMIIMMIV